MNSFLLRLVLLLSLGMTGAGRGETLAGTRGAETRFKRMSEVVLPELPTPVGKTPLALLVSVLNQFNAAYETKWKEPLGLYVSADVLQAIQAGQRSLSPFPERLVEVPLIDALRGWAEGYDLKYSIVAEGVLITLKSPPTH